MSILSLTTTARGFRVTCGTEDIRNLSDGAFPVDLWKCRTLEDASHEEEKKGRAMRADTLQAAALRCGRGTRYNAVKEWVEVRTPLCRVTS